MRRGGAPESRGAWMRKTAQGDEITILLALFNGARNLGPQLQSFVDQSHANWRLIVSDDGSTDAGPAIVHAFAAAAGGRAVHLIDGPRRGFGQNFLHLLRAAGPETPYAALSDQDDVWLPHKISRGIEHLARVPRNVPALYGSRTWVCDKSLRRLRPSPLFRRPPGFRNALMQSIAGGNTMMLNRAALTLAQQAAEEASQIVSHDWWLYQLVSGVGGRVIYDAEPTVLYRQHGANLVGANVGLKARLHRIGILLGGGFRDWNGINLRALSASAHRLTDENRRILEGFARLRAGPASGRLARMRRLGLYRQSTPGQAALFLAAPLGLI